MNSKRKQIKSDLGKNSKSADSAQTAAEALNLDSQDINTDDSGDVPSDQMADQNKPSCLQSH